MELTDAVIPWTLLGVVFAGWLCLHALRRWRQPEEVLEVAKIRSVTIVGEGFYSELGPWAHVRRVEGARLVSREWVDFLVDEANLGHVGRRDKAWIDEIEESVRADGFHYAFTIVVDSVGRVCLKDGHHRLIVARRLGLPVVPVALDFSDGTIRKHHRHVTEIGREFWSG